MPASPLCVRAGHTGGTGQLAPRRPELSSHGRGRAVRTRGHSTHYVVPQVFRRLVDDGLMRRLPCLLLTACGFPDYASRAALRRAADALDVPVLHPRLQKSARTSDWPMCVECGGLVEADPRPGEPRAKHRRSRASRMGGAWRMGGGSRVRSQTAPQPRSSSSPSSSMVKVSVYIARAAHTLRRGRPVLEKPDHLLRATTPEGSLLECRGRLRRRPTVLNPGPTSVLLRSRVPAQRRVSRIYLPPLASRTTTRMAWP